ncbi:hypothetical protein CWI36_0025p0060 [Hamiltosporidium magnivora]|uniref:WD40 domain-containing protein n=1 Tax=Hamiltosporidium magnivora TaxID=148818 RepID=A0A4Q9LNF9_9MICR|nr:hypothetical protein CWI36_0025p0060 [Hamiltosporidium magnivora]
MENFTSTVFCVSKLKQELTLPHTKTVILHCGKQAIKSFNGVPVFFVSFYRKNFIFFQISPYKEIKSIVYLEEFKNYTFFNDKICVLKDNSVEYLDGEKMLEGDFSQFTDIYMINDNIVLSGNKYLKIFKICRNNSENEKKVFSVENMHSYFIKCDCFFIGYAVTLIGRKNLIDIKKENQLLGTLTFPENITSVISDTLVTKVYSGSESGKIYFSSLEDNNCLEHILYFHESSIIQLKMSFCEKFLYSLDSNGKIAVWNTEYNNFLGFNNFEAESMLVCCENEVGDFQNEDFIK